MDAETGIILLPRDSYVNNRLTEWEKENPKPKARKGVGDWREDRRQEYIDAKTAWDEIPKIYKIDLERRILVSKDQPHADLLAMLRPLLSHDEKEMRNKIVDRSEGGGHKTKHIWIIGYPTAIFCTATFIQDEQEQTRFFILSPEVEQEKKRQAIQLQGILLGNRPKYLSELEANMAINRQKQRVRAIKEAGIKEIIIPPRLAQEAVDRFLREHPILAPRHMRDFPRLVSMITAHALNNLFNREHENEKKPGQ